MFIREHPFNLKGGGGAMVFSDPIFFSLRSRPTAEEKKMRQVVATYFFSTKTIILKAQSPNRIFFSAHFRDRKCF